MNLQGADNNLVDEFYKLTFKYIKDGYSLLNVGSGIVFNFERLLANDKKVFITSVDIVPIKDKPAFVKDYMVKNIEETFKLDREFDIVTAFEVIEHIDKTDVLINNCYNNLKNNGILILSFPNLASLYSRIELMLGYQPHILEISNVYSNLGTGIFGKINSSNNNSIHHLRGITYKAMKEFLHTYGFEILDVLGYDWRFKILFHYLPSFAAVNIFICRKRDSQNCPSKNR